MSFIYALRKFVQGLLGQRWSGPTFKDIYFFKQCPPNSNGIDEPTYKNNKR